MTIVLRVLLALWGLFFGVIAVHGILDPQVFTDNFGLVGEGAARNALRADFGAFFLVGALPGLWAALQPSRAQLLVIPITLFGAVLVLRVVGVAMGDVPNLLAMAAEAVSVVLLLGARQRLGQEAAQAYG